MGKDTKTDDKKHAVGTDGKEGKDPWEILDDLGNRLEKTVRMFDMRLMNNKNSINDIKGYLNKLIEECQVSLEHKIDLFDRKINALVKEVEKLEREKG